MGGIVDIEDDVGLRNGVEGATNAHLLKGVVAMSEARGVDDAEGSAVDDESFLYSVAGGAGDVADNGTVVAQLGIEKR